MREKISGKTYDAERALYGSNAVDVTECIFDGPADGESAFKESQNVNVSRCYFNLRYPFWHNKSLIISHSEMTPLCRAALWYCNRVEITDSKLNGIKALRECEDIKIENCNIVSPEFGWSVKGVEMSDSTVQSEYFMLRSDKLKFSRVTLSGKYSFQYIRNSAFRDCVFDTKDAFWHAKNVTVINSVVKGEYLGWYSENLTLINCKISGTQPLCYCKNLRLENCELTNADLCFENSTVEATLTTPVISIKNPRGGHISVPELGELITDDTRAKGKVTIKK